LVLEHQPAFFWGYADSQTRRGTETPAVLQAFAQRAANFTLGATRRKATDLPDRFLTLTPPIGISGWLCLGLKKTCPFRKTTDPLAS
jgi:hypothetical protein